MAIYINGVEQLAVGLESGDITIWSGLIADIPAGRLICDGNNGTPNLLAKFVEGVATALTDPGATGGATAKTTSGHQHNIPLHTSGGTVHGDYDKYGTGDTYTMDESGGGGTPDDLDEGKSKSNTDTIADIRPIFYDVAFLMKT